MSMSQAGRVRDVVVVGGGHNGLACAAYLAKAGLDVVVAERREVLGGAAVTEEPWPGYRVSSASYVVSLLPPRIVRELDLHRHGYRLSIVTPDYFVPFPDGSGLTLWGDTARDAAEIAKFSTADADSYTEFDRYFGRVAHLLRDLLFVVPPNLSLGDLPRWAAVGARLRGWTGRDVAEAVRLFTMSAADFLDEWFGDDRVKGALATQAIIGAWCGPMSPGSAYVLVHHWIGEVDGHDGAWGWVDGGMGGVSQALARAARAAGAEIRTDAGQPQTTRFSAAGTLLAGDMPAARSSTVIAETKMNVRRELHGSPLRSWRSSRPAHSSDSARRGGHPGTRENPPGREPDGPRIAGGGQLPGGRRIHAHQYRRA